MRWRGRARSRHWPNHTCSRLHPSSFGSPAWYSSGLVFCSLPRLLFFSFFLSCAVARFPCPLLCLRRVRFARRRRNDLQPGTSVGSEVKQTHPRPPETPLLLKGSAPGGIEAWVQARSMGNDRRISEKQRANSHGRPWHKRGIESLVSAAFPPPPKPPLRSSPARCGPMWCHGGYTGST